MIKLNSISLIYLFSFGIVVPSSAPSPYRRLTSRQQSLQFSSAVSEVALEPNGNRLAVGTMNGAVHVCDLRMPRITLPLEEKGVNGKSSNTITSLEWGPHNQDLIIGSCNGHIRFFNPRLQIFAKRFLYPIHNKHCSIFATAVRPKKGVVAIALNHKNIPLHTMVDARKSRLLRSNSEGSCATMVAWNRSGTHLAAGYSDNIVRIWDSKDNITQVTMPDKGLISSIAWSHKDSIALGGFRNAVWYKGYKTEKPAGDIHIDYREGDVFSQGVFSSLLVDEDQVKLHAIHTNGKTYCLDMSTKTVTWKPIIIDSDNSIAATSLEKINNHKTPLVACAYGGTVTLFKTE